LILALSALAWANAQSVQVQGRFLSDSMKVGMPVYYVLTARYPQDATVLFPDSTFSFAPFEWVSRTYAPSRTRRGETLDSAAYRLVSFETDSVQRLQLPVFVVHGQDCTAWLGLPDSVFLQRLVTHAPDSVQAAALPMKINTTYQFVSKLFNYPLALVVAAGVLVAGGLALLFFGRPLRRYLQRRKLLRRHRHFQLQFEQHIGRLEQGFSPAQAEACVGVWKKYMEQLLQLPVTKLTSREIAQRLPYPPLKPALSAIDRMIYAGRADWSREPFLNLKEQGEKMFQKKVEELMHG
jgi:hypothetical protein